MSETIKENEVNDYRIHVYTNGHKYTTPHFFILSKGMNSGKPLREPCANCFVCWCDTEEVKERLFWLCFGLWKAKAFQFYLLGSVISYMRLGDARKVIEERRRKAELLPVKFEKAVNLLRSIDEYESNLKKQVSTVSAMRMAAFKEFV